MKINMRSVVATITLATLSSFTLAVQADTKNMPAVQDYTYNTKLDIAKVTHSPSLDFCGVQPVEMSYVDHTHAAHTLRYEVEGLACDGYN